MHRILLRHTYVVIFLQLFSLICSLHLIWLIVFNTFDLLIIPLTFQHRNWSSNNTVDFPIIQSIFQHNNLSSNDTVDLPIIQCGWKDGRRRQRQYPFWWYCSFAMCIPVRTNIHGSVAFPVLLPIDIENPHHYWVCRVWQLGDIRWRCRWCLP